MKLDLHRVRRTAFSPEMIATSLAAAAVVAGLSMRWIGLGKTSLWWDEGFTAWTVNHSPGFIVRFARIDNQPPLYYLLQHYWNAVFGSSEYAMRSLSAFFGTLSLPVFYFLAKRVLKDGLAVALAVCLFAFSTKQIWYSREARAYEVASFFALVALYALILFLDKRSATSFATIVLSATATLYLHNMMFFYLLALNVTWLIYPSERSWVERFKELFLADALIGLLYLPWAFSLLTQVAAVQGNLWWIPKPTVWTLASTLKEMSGLEPTYLIAFAGRFLPLSPRMVRVGVVGALDLLWVAMLAGGFWRVSNRNRLRNFSLLLWGLLPILAVFVLSQKMPLYLDRIFTASSAVFPIVFAFALALHKGPKGRVWYGLLGIALVGATALSALGFLRYREAAEKSNEDWRATTSSLLRIPEKNRLIVFVPPGGEILFDYYAQQFPAMDQNVPRIGLPASFNSQFPPPKGRSIDDQEINRLKLAVESKKYSEIDLVLVHNVDPHWQLFNYLNGIFVPKEQEESDTNSVKFVRFLARPD